MENSEPFLADAQHAVAAGLDYARQHGHKMTVLVLDATGTVSCAARMDGARTITYSIALAKANTSREFEASTAELAARVKPENKIAIGQVGSNIAFLGGGEPIIRDGQLIGAIGASGASEEEDIECARLALTAFNGRTG